MRKYMHEVERLVTTEIIDSKLALMKDIRMKTLTCCVWHTIETLTDVFVIYEPDAQLGTGDRTIHEN